SPSECDTSTTSMAMTTTSVPGCAVYTSDAGCTGQCSMPQMDATTIECPQTERIYVDGRMSSMYTVFCDGTDWRTGRDTLPSGSKVYCGPLISTTSTTTATTRCELLSLDYPRGCADCSSPVYRATLTYCPLPNLDLYYDDAIVGNLTCVAGAYWTGSKQEQIPALSIVYCRPPPCPELSNVGGPASCTSCSAFEKNSTHVFCPIDHKLKYGMELTVNLACVGSNWQTDLAD
ncbi:hypothetical protein PENTCL1PPCAC_12847, partial [Pristionchus entomophagus]